MLTHARDAHIRAGQQHGSDEILPGRANGAAVSENGTWASPRITRVHCPAKSLRSLRSWMHAAAPLLSLRLPIRHNPVVADLKAIGPPC